MFTSEVYTLQDNTTIDGKIITAGELVVNSQYLCSMQVESSNSLNHISIKSKVEPNAYNASVVTCLVIRLSQILIYLSS